MEPAIKPTENHIAVKEIVTEDKTKSGILLPKADTTTTHKVGEVVKIHPQVKEVSIGDLILFKKWAGQDLEINGVKYLVMHINDVYAVLEEKVYEHESK